MARGRLMHTRFLWAVTRTRRRPEDPGELPLFERAAVTGRSATSGRRGRGAVLVGCFRQVVRRDDAAAVPALERSLELASRAGDRAAMAEVLRHLGIPAHATGDMELARQRLEESTRLRREVGHFPAAAANMVGLAYIATAQDVATTRWRCSTRPPRSPRIQSRAPHPPAGQRGARGPAAAPYRPPGLTSTQ